MITDKEFKERVAKLVGFEYTFIEEYIKAKTKITVRHNTCKHEYQVTPDNFLRGKRCPKCFGGVRKSNIKFINEVENLIGSEYTFLESYINNHTPIKVIHNKCANEYKVSPSSFIRLGSRCPKCANERRAIALTLTNEEFLEKVYLSVGEEYTFLDDYNGKKKKIKVRHNVCGHIYKTTPENFNSGKRCKKCSDKEQRKTNDTFKQEIFDLVGTDYTFLEDYKSARTNIKVIHNKCNHIFYTSPNNFLRGNRCPNCFVSKGELAIEKVLKLKNVIFKREVTFDDLKIENHLRYDFGIYDKDNKIKILIEYDGRHHFTPIEAWGGEEYYRKVIKRDEMKNSYAKNNNISIKRIPYWEYDNIEEIIDKALLDIGLS